MTPEQEAREKIDDLLRQCGGDVQEYLHYNPSAAPGVALRKVPVQGGRCDYLLLVNRKPVGVIEAKKAGTTLSTVADQSGFYSSNLPEVFKSAGTLPFYYESTGIETFFRDERDPFPRSRRVFAFHRPETIVGWVAETSTLRARLAQMAFARPNPKNRHDRTESERFKSFAYEDLLKRDKVNLDLFWLKDETLEDSAKLPEPHVLAAEITEDLEAALEQFATIAEDLKQ